VFQTNIVHAGEDEYAPYYARYIQLVQGEDALAALKGQIGVTVGMLAKVPETGAQHRYAPGKWSIKQSVGHLSDAERIVSYRALRIARGDETPLPGFDENAYAERAGSDQRLFRELIDELACVRAATVALFASLDPAALLNRGVANGLSVSVRALAWMIAGHELHHVRMLRERYGVSE
jgi:hypothetical protein